MRRTQCTYLGQCGAHLHVAWVARHELVDLLERLHRVVHARHVGERHARRVDLRAFVGCGGGGGRSDAGEDVKVLAPLLRSEPGLTALKALESVQEPGCPRGCCVLDSNATLCTRQRELLSDVDCDAGGNGEAGSRPYIAYIPRRRWDDGSVTG